MTKAVQLTVVLLATLCYSSAQIMYDSLLIERSRKAYQTGTIDSDSLARIYLQEAIHSRVNYSFVTARKLLHQSEELIDNQSSSLYASVLSEYAEMAMEEDDRIEAIELLDLILVNYKALQDSINYLRTLRRIGHNYDYLGEHEAARSYYQDCVDLAGRLGDPATIARCLYNIGGTFCEDQEYEKGFPFYERALVIATKYDLTAILHMIHHAMSIDYRVLGDVDKSLFHAYQSLQLSRQTGNLKTIGFSYQGLGWSLFNAGDLDSAEYYMNLTLKVGKEVSNHQLIDNAQEVLEQIYYRTGRYQKAYDTFQQMTLKRDSIFNIQNSRVVADMRERYQTERKERQLAEKNLQLQAASSDLNRHRNLQIVLILCVLLLMVVLFLIYRGYLLRKRANDILHTKNTQIEKHLKEIEDFTDNKNRWFVNVAHELRTPLTLIKGPIQKILSTNELTSDMRSDLELVHRNTRSLSNMVNEILDLSKMEEGEVVIKESIFAIDAMVNRVVSAFESRAEQLGISLKSSYTTHDQVNADYEKLEKVVVNLISNALKFTPRGGLIEVFVAKGSKGNLKVVVKDTGKGISAEDIDYVFDRFYQSKDASKVVGGTGVGLALSKEIAEMHGGELKVSSTPGMGSTFTLILPEEIILQEEALLPSIEALKEETLGVDSLDEPTFDKKPKLLLLEDNEDMTAYISSLLTPYFEVKKAPSGILGLEVLSQHHVQFIISDIMMPEMDGVSFLKEVKKNTSWKHIPFIHLTALTDEALKKELFQIGVDDYLLKPFDSEELIIRVRNLYNNYIQRISLTEHPNQTESYDEKVISRLKKQVLENIDDSNFNVLRLADAAAMSERQLYRYLKATTGFTPLQFIQEIKLNYANDLARRKTYASISELSAAVGFKQASYFSNLFEKRFGKKPGLILKS